MGYITESKIVKEKIEVLPCVKCGNEDIEINDCGYSSFNVAYGKCKKCKHEVKFGCGCFIDKKTIVENWNNANNPEILKTDYESQIIELRKKIDKLPIKKQ